MNVTLVTETYPPEVNGVAMTLGRLVGGLRARGQGVAVIRPRQKDEKAGASGAGEYVVPGWPIPGYEALRMGLPVTGRLRRRWRTVRPDVVHIATEGPLGWAALRAARGLGLRVTLSFHTNFHHYGAHYGALGFWGGRLLAYLRWFHNRTACTLAPTAQMCAELEGMGFQRLKVMARGVDTKLFTPARRSAELRAAWGATEADPVFMYVGRLAAEKNLALAVEAFAAVQARAPAARVVFVGDGPERAALAAKYPQFHYAGVRRGEELAAHYASADVFVFPSLSETFGNVVTEAMASGLVTLAFDYAATREHIRTGVNGVAVPCEDAAGFVARAAGLLDERAGWPAMRVAARATAERLTWDVIVEKFAADLRGDDRG